QPYDPRTSPFFAVAERFWRFVCTLRDGLGDHWLGNHKLTPVAARTYNLLSELVEAFATAALSRDRLRRAYKRRMGHGPLPPGQGWLIAIAPELHSHGLDFINLLQSPEMRALLAARPGLWRYLRRICRMFAIQSIDAPPLPKQKPRRYRPRPKRTDAARHEAEMCKRYGPQG
ncbi:MAG: hypothetical protein KGI51_13745, partial [Rhodospirillales bacterium]|nr:hypothetical protein [Rhodospirillales bacterium]